MITNLIEFVESLVRPLRILVVDCDPSTSRLVKQYLSPYHVEICSATCACPAIAKIKNGFIPDLTFLASPLTPLGRAVFVLEDIIRNCPRTRVVIVADSQDEEGVVEMMKLGSFTFLKKGSTLDTSHVQRLAGQLNIKLRSSGDASKEIPIVTNVETVNCNHCI